MTELEHGPMDMEVEGDDAVVEGEDDPTEIHAEPGMIPLNGESGLTDANW